MKQILIILLIVKLTSCDYSPRSVSNSGKASQKIASFDQYSITSDTVVIGTQIWTTRNLEVNTFRNGDSIREAKSVAEFMQANKEGKPAWCYYANDTYNQIYGKIYNWYAVSDKRGLAPTGWHIPTTDEWDVLTSFLGGEEVCGKKLRHTNGWYKGGNGDNSSGFSAIPGGHFMHYEFGDIGKLGFWWTSTNGGDGAAYARYLNYSYHPLLFAGFSTSSGFSVRCVKD